MSNTTHKSMPSQLSDADVKSPEITPDMDNTSLNYNDFDNKDDASSDHYGWNPLIWKKRDYPPLDYSNWPAFKATLKERLQAIFTRRFVICLVWGQVLSLCITLTSVCTTELSMRNWAMPATQSFFVYFTLFCCYTPYTIYSYGFRAYAKMFLTDGWRYIILAAVDVEANYTVVLAYQYTDLLSAALLDCWATPVCMVVAYFLVKSRYHWSQILGVLISMVGLALLVVSDFIVRGGSGTAVNKPKGDGFMILGATLYGVSNGLEEFLVRNRPLYEVVGQLGLWGTIINGAQAAGLEHHKWVHGSNWDGKNIGFLIGFISAMLVIYTTAPLLFRASSSPFYNLSILSSDFFALLIGFAVFKQQTYWLYGLAFPLVIIGLVIYFSCSSPAHQTGKRFEVEARGKKASHLVTIA